MSFVGNCKNGGNGGATPEGKGMTETAEINRSHDGRDHQSEGAHGGVPAAGGVSLLRPAGLLAGLILKNVLQTELTEHGNVRTGAVQDRVHKDRTR